MSREANEKNLATGRRQRRPVEEFIRDEPVTYGDVNSLVMRGADLRLYLLLTCQMIKIPLSGEKCALLKLPSDVAKKYAAFMDRVDGSVIITLTSSEIMGKMFEDVGLDPFEDNMNVLAYSPSGVARKVRQGVELVMMGGAEQSRASHYLDINRKMGAVLDVNHDDGRKDKYLAICDTLKEQVLEELGLSDDVEL